MAKDQHVINLITSSLTEHSPMTCTCDIWYIPRSSRYLFVTYHVRAFKDQLTKVDDSADYLSLHFHRPNTRHPVYGPLCAECHQQCLDQAQYTM